MNTDPDKKSDPGDDIPRMGFWEGMPKRTLSRVILLVALLVGIMYLRQRTESIAGCMSDAFRVQPVRPPTVRLAAPAGDRSPTMDADAR
jgi:hypothetical protein